MQTVREDNRIFPRLEPLWDDPLTASLAASWATPPLKECFSGRCIVFVTGRENDQPVLSGVEGGLYYYRARYYSPTLQRFISEDPIGLDGGINFYVYVGNNPITRVDPFGLKIDLTEASGKLKDALDKVKKTKRGEALYDILDQSKTIYKIRDRRPGDPASAFRRDKEIVVDPNFHPIIQTTDGPKRASTERILGHEMGHAATSASDFTGPAPGTNSIINENPIAVELGESPRTQY